MKCKWTVAKVSKIKRFYRSKGGCWPRGSSDIECVRVVAVTKSAMFLDRSIPNVRSFTKKMGLRWLAAQLEEYGRARSLHLTKLSVMKMLEEDLIRDLEYHSQCLATDKNKLAALSRRMRAAERVTSKEPAR